MSTASTVFSGAGGASGWRAALVILGYGIILTLPAGWSGYVIGHDTFSHLIMSRHFVDQLWAGDFYPRWMSNMNAGLGSPVFQFYGPVPYYITALFRPLLSHDPEGWHQLGLAAALAVVASGFTAHAWLRQLAGERAALVGAVLYMSAPYHLAVDLYQRFAFAELWGFVWMPLVMLCARASMRDGKGALTGLSLSYALLIMTHLPTALLFSWVPLAYALWLARPDERRGAFIRVAGGMLLGIGLAAIYLVPALVTRQFVRFDIMESGHFHFAHHFLFYAPGRDDGVKDFMYSLGVTVGAMVLVAAGVWSLGRKTWSGSVRREAGFWLGIACLAFFMMIYPSKPVWEAIAILQAVQFPWRLAALLTFAMTVLVTLWTDAVLPKRFFTHPVSALILGMLLLYQAIPTLKEYAQYGMWSMTPRLAGLTALINKMEANAGAEGGAGYGQATVFLGAARLSRYNSFVPRWSNPELFADTVEAVRALEKLASRPDKAWRVAGTGSVLVTHWQAPRIELLADAQTPMKIEVLQLYYPGWVARLDGAAALPEVAPSRPDGLLELQIPAGKHRVVIERESLDQERAGQMVSILSILLLSGYLFWPRFLAALAPLFDSRPRIMTTEPTVPADQETAAAFATSWNHLPAGSIYTREQFEDWLFPVTRPDIQGKTVLELGCGNGSLLVHMADWAPGFLGGVDLGDSVTSAQTNLERLPFKNWRIAQADMIGFRSGQPYDFVYSIGVLHHLKDPKLGLDAVIANTRSGGCFHCWVYAKEGNGLIIHLVDPIRKRVSRLPWWVTKYLVATPLAWPYYLYAKAISRLRPRPFLKRFPLYEYSCWISRRNFAFFRHVAFDQLVTPQTAYISRPVIEAWLASYDNIDRGSVYIVMRNGNSWKFGASLK